MLLGVPLGQPVLHDAAAEAHEEVAGDVVVGRDQRGLVAHRQVVVRHRVSVVDAPPRVDVQEAAWTSYLGDSLLSDISSYFHGHSCNSVPSRYFFNSSFPLSV